MEAGNKSFRYSKFETAIRHSNGEVKWAVRYPGLKFREEVEIGHFIWNDTT